MNECIKIIQLLESKNQKWKTVNNKLNEPV